MKIAIIYSTSSSTTKRAAEMLKGKLDCHTQLIPVQKAKNACLLKYDFIILGTSISKGRVQGEMKRFISRNMKTLKERPVGLFINSPEDNESNFDKAFSRELVESSLLVSDFGDEINPDEGGFLEKRGKSSLVSKYKKEGRKIPVLDMNEIDSFAGKINERIKRRI